MNEETQNEIRDLDYFDLIEWLIEHEAELDEQRMVLRCRKNNNGRI